ncbi:MAG TPA: S4 domain-containing protein, partial [Draconibacterium sp.]|nr:S4 domain-containing protein [Draconibacterium sp.]
MKNNYSRKSQNETGKGGKRIGKSLPPKTTGFAKSKSAAVPKSTAGDQKFSTTDKKRVYRKPKTVGIKNIPKKSNPTGEMRLNRFIANAGVCSRREADTYISAGMVSVNGVIVTELGVKVLPTDEVRFDGTRLNPEKKVYLLLNKPKDFVTTTEDPHADKI